MRADLAMPPGKLAAQAGHAFLDAYSHAQLIRPDAARAYNTDCHGTKIVLVVPDEDALCHAHTQACAAGIPAALITDSGHVLLPHFTGAPVITALGLGPATRDEVRHITRGMALA